MKPSNSWSFSPGLVARVTLHASIEVRHLKIGAVGQKPQGSLRILRANTCLSRFRNLRTFVLRAQKFGIVSCVVLTALTPAHR